MPPVSAEVNRETGLEDDSFRPADRGEASVEPVSKSREQQAEKSVSKSKKKHRSPVSKVLNFPMLTGEQTGKKLKLLTGEQKKTKDGKQKTSAPLLTGEQTDDLKPFLPEPEAGFYWEAPADDKGFKIKLRWRNADKKLECYVFRRLGKRQLQTLRKGTHEEQRSDLADRLTGELIEAGRFDLAARIQAGPQNDSRSVHSNSATA